MTAIACRWCSTPFTVPARRRGRLPKFCSEPCREAHGVKYHAERRKTYVPPPRKLHERACVVCATVFSTPNLRTVCCGPTCGLRLGKLRSDATRSANAAARATVKQSGGRA